MAKRAFLLVLLFCPLIASAQEQPTSLFPAIEPHQTGFLQVSDQHTLYWEVSGNDEGLPVIALHGGPGGSSGRGTRRLFDPQRYRIIQFDQRGAGKSTPFSEWRENNTQLLIEDINKIRAHLGVDGKVILFGLSWGTTLALAYAEAYPDNVAGLVLWGVFTCREQEIDHLYHGGVAPFYPENYQHLQQIVPDPQRMNYPEQLFEVITGADRLLADSAIVAFATYEAWMENVGATYEGAVEDGQSPESRSLSVLENYYMMNRCFLAEGQLLNDAERIAHAPIYIVNGRLDMLTPPTIKS